MSETTIPRYDDKVRRVEREPADWSILEDTAIVDAASKAARKVASQFESVAEFEDLRQDAMIFLGLNATKMRLAVDERGCDRVHRLVWQHLYNSVETEAKHMGSRLSYEALTSGVDE